MVVFVLAASLAVAACLVLWLDWQLAAERRRSTRKDATIAALRDRLTDITPVPCPRCQWAEYMVSITRPRT